MRISSANKNTIETWESYFRDGWERNDGRRQTRLFAKYFLDTVELPAGARTLLDVGCGMGDALPEIHARYPHLNLTGCDVSKHAIEMARRSYGSFAEFQNWGFDDIVGTYDIIYCSNTLEHFECYRDIARCLIGHCQRLYVLVPYRELKDGRPLTVEPGAWHVVTFTEQSFDDLKHRGLLRGIRHWIHPCPVAWGPPPPPFWRRMFRPLRPLRNFLLRRTQPAPRRQIFFELERA